MLSLLLRLIPGFTSTVSLYQYVVVVVGAIDRFAVWIRSRSFELSIESTVELAPHRFPLSPSPLSLTHSLTPSLLPFLPRLTLGIIYPTFKSFEAIESKTTQADDEQWLTYWVVYVTLNILETLMWPVLMWVPLYSVLKCGVISWLVMPRFCGARLLYTLFVRKGLYMAAETLKEVPAFEDVVKAFVDKSDGKGKVATQSHSVAGGAEHAD